MTPHQFLHRIHSLTEGRARDFVIENIFNDDYLKAYKNFLTYYEPDLLVKPGMGSSTKSVGNNRVCRFCNQGVPAVSFKKRAHLLPQLMGDKRLTHFVECDTCNEKFGLYENSFSNFIGIYRTVDKMQGQEGIPIFKSPDKKLRIEYIKQKDSFAIDGENGPVFDEAANKFVLATKKHTYIPLRVMKCLYKIGYSLLQDDELCYYRPALKLVVTEEFDGILSGGGHFGKLYRFSFPTTFRSPTILTYRKKSGFEQEKLPTKIVTIYFGRFMYQFIMPNSTDHFMYQKGIQTAWMLVPPLWNANKFRPVGELIDLSSSEPKKGEEENLEIHLNDPFGPDQKNS